MNSFSCVITGHRPTRFKFKYNEKDKRCQRIKKCLQEQLIRLYNQGVRCFWAGGAMGADMWASEILLRMKEQTAYQDVELCLALPFEGYDADWDDWHRKRMKFIRKYAAKVLILGEMPSSENYKKRNCFMERFWRRCRNSMNGNARYFWPERWRKKILRLWEQSLDCPIKGQRRFTTGRFRKSERVL